MSTITIWLLVSLGSSAGNTSNSGRATQVIERFATQEECMRVYKVITIPSREPVQCVQATVVKTW
jgi:hypothetical protein